MCKIIDRIAKCGLIPGLMVLLFAVNVAAHIDGVSGTGFNITARPGYISTADGNSVYTWGYALDAGTMQYPGPTLILDQGNTITITLRNELPLEAGRVSMVFPGHHVNASGGFAGLLTREAPPDGITAVTYTFYTEHAGTYLYHSGSNPTLQIEMGLMGVIIVRPYGYNPMMPRAYNHPDSAYDMEYLFLLSEMDPLIHEIVEFSGVAALQSSDFLSHYFPNYWFINGRTAPDTMVAPGTSWLPTQPYNCMPMMHPGDKLLMRVIDAGRDLHPFHHHGNHSLIIARDGRLLESAPGVSGPDLAQEVFTIQSVPGETVDAIFEWTGAGLGWDIYGHEQDVDYPPLGNFPSAEDIDHNMNGIFDSVPLEPHEYEPDHGKPFPVILPEHQDVTFGGFYSGSPFLGYMGDLPPGEGGMNPHAGFVYMWHSHTEKEMTNFDIFPGGNMTMLIIVPPGVMIHPMMLPETSEEIHLLSKNREAVK